MLNFTAEQGIIIQLRVEGPGESGLYHHRAVALGDVSVAKVVQRVRGVHPAGELPAHHCLWDDLRCRTRLVGLLALSVKALGALCVQASRSALGIKEGEGPMQFSVVEVPADERPGSSYSCGASSSLDGRGFSVGNYFY